VTTDDSETKKRLTPDDWVACFVESVRRRLPGLDRILDVPALQATLREVMRDPGAFEASRRELDLIAECLLRSDTTAAFFQRIMGDEPRFVDALNRVISTFSRRQDSPPAPENARRDAVVAFVRLAVDLLRGRRLGRVERARKREERARARRACQLESEPESRDVEPWIEASADELADQIISQIEREMPEAIAALRALHSDPIEVTASEQAKRHGFSPSKMSRAISRLRDLTKQAFKGIPVAVRRPFQLAFYRRLLRGTG
jgi:hypothetical protein